MVSGVWLITARRYVLVGVTRRKHRVGSRYLAPAGPESCHVLDPDRAESERHGVQGGGACPAAAKRKRGRTFCRPGTEFCGLYEFRGTELSRY